MMHDVSKLQKEHKTRLITLHYWYLAIITANEHHITKRGCTSAHATKNRINDQT